jgi:hypothetical protein
VTCSVLRSDDALGPHDEQGMFMVLSLEIGIRVARAPGTPWVLQEIEAWHIGDGYATGPARYLAIKPWC